MRYGKTDFPIKNLSSVDWSAAKIIYFSPDDRRIVRTSFIVDSKLGSAPLGSESFCGDTEALLEPAEGRTDLVIR